MLCAIQRVPCRIGIFVCIDLALIINPDLVAGQLGSFGFFGVLLGPFGLFWILLGSFRLFWSLLGSFGFFWVLLGSFGLFWALLGSFGLFWALYSANEQVCAGPDFPIVAPSLS